MTVNGKRQINVLTHGAVGDGITDNTVYIQGAINQSDNQADEMVVTDQDTGITYIFRGRRTYKIVDGKEVLVRQEGDGTTAK